MFFIECYSIYLNASYSLLGRIPSTRTVKKKKEITEFKYLCSLSSLDHSSKFSTLQPEHLIKIIFDYVTLLTKTFLWPGKALRQRTKILKWFTSPGNQDSSYYLDYPFLLPTQLTLSPLHTTNYMLFSIQT